jgi:XTP/dITP diphosphohydrolase
MDMRTRDIGEPMTRVLIATRNKGKLREFQRLFSHEDVEFVTLDDLGDNAEVIEDGTSFEDNARLKAAYFARKHGIITIADDSGLVVDALEGAPGVHSARYSGKGDMANNMKLLDEMEGVTDRRARFVAVIALCLPDGIIKTYHGSVEGEIGHEPAGDNGFGYDPLFVIPELHMTFAQAKASVKDKISHRARALRALMEDFDEALGHK